MAVFFLLGEQPNIGYNPIQTSSKHKVVLATSAQLKARPSCFQIWSGLGITINMQLNKPSSHNWEDRKSRNFMISGLVLRITLIYEKVIYCRVSFGFFQIILSPIIFTVKVPREVDVKMVNDWNYVLS